MGSDPWEQSVQSQKSIRVLPYLTILMEPQPYDRWTFQGMFDLPNEIKVADEFWDFLGGEKPTSSY